MDPKQMQQMLEQAQEMAQKLQTEMAQKAVDGSAGGGLVVATVDGQGELLRMKIDPSLLKSGDVTMLEDLCVAAVHDAQTKVRKQLAEHMQKLGVPGFNR